MSDLIVRKRVVSVTIALLVALGVLWGLISTLQASVAAQTSAGRPPSPSQEPTVGANSTSAPGLPLTLTAYQAWFGLDSHLQPPPYISTDTATISGHITAALAQGIDGFVVDWYGPEAGVANDPDREFIDEATAKLLQQAEGRGFYVALMYDEGTVRWAETLTTAYESRVISDLLYARQYFTMPAYLDIQEYPALFVFAYDTVDPYINWEHVRDQLGIRVTLLDRDPNPADPAHDDPFDGFYAWVQPTAGQWDTGGTEWGQGYLAWFYNTMAASPYTDDITIGAVWPGFDDALASWGSERYIWPRCGQTWLDTWDIAKQYAPPIVMIDTWNDFEEGTDIEYGTGECLVPSREKCAPLPRGPIAYAHTLANTGKFADTFNIEAHSSNLWPTVMSSTTVTLAGHASTTLGITLTVPATLRVGMQDVLAVTATSTLSMAVHSSVVNTTTACGSFAPIVLKDHTWRSIHISGPATVHSRFDDVYGTWAGFPVQGVTVRLYAQESNRYWCIQPSQAANVSSDQWTAAGQFGGITSYGVFAVVADGNGDQLPGCASAPGYNYITATSEEQFRSDIRPYVYLGDSRAISPRFVISRVE